VTALHPNLNQLAHLVGTWRGRGRGSYPTIETFEYEETVTLEHLGKPYLVYTQRSSVPGGGAALHSESGYLRVPSPEVIEAVIAHATGHVEVGSGEISAGSLRLTSRLLATGTAKSVQRIDRLVEFDGDVLSYELSMAAVGVELSTHLRGDLRRFE
jgi:hypothetical protein